MRREEEEREQCKEMLFAFPILQCKEALFACLLDATGGGGAGTVAGRVSAGTQHQIHQDGFLLW